MGSEKITGCFHIRYCPGNASAHTEGAGRYCDSQLLDGGIESNDGEGARGIGTGATADQENVQRNKVRCAWESLWRP